MFEGLEDRAERAGISTGTFRTVVFAVIFVPIACGFYFFFVSGSRPAKAPTEPPAKVEFDNAPAKSIDAARRTLQVLKKFGAKLEIGMNRIKYGEELGDVWAEVKTFLESDESAAVPTLKKEFQAAMDCYKLAANSWDTKIRTSSSELSQLETKMIRSDWEMANYHIEQIEAFLKTH